MLENERLDIEKSFRRPDARFVLLWTSWLSLRFLCCCGIGFHFRSILRCHASVKDADDISTREEMDSIPFGTTQEKRGKQQTRRTEKSTKRACVLYVPPGGLRTLRPGLSRFGPCGSSHPSHRLEMDRSSRAWFFEILVEWMVRFRGHVSTWLILPVVICLSQRLSHACLSINILYCETANGSLNQL